MSSDFNDFNHSGYNAFIHGGFNARTGDSIPATTAYMCFDPVTGVVKWVLRRSTLDALFKDADMAGNAYLTTNDGQSLVRVNLGGVQEFFIPFPNTQSTPVAGSADGAISSQSAIGSTGAVSTGVVSVDMDEAGAMYQTGSAITIPATPARKTIVNGNYALLWQNPNMLNSGLYAGTNLGQQVYFLDTNRLIQFNRATGAAVLGAPLAGLLNRTHSMCVDVTGNIWIDYKKYSPAGAILLDIQFNTYGGVDFPFEVLADRFGDTYVRMTNGRFIKIDNNGNSVWILPANQGAYTRKDRDLTYLFADANSGLYGQISVNNGIPGYTSPTHIDSDGVRDKTYLFNGSLLTQRAGHLFASLTLQAGEPDPVNVL